MVTISARDEVALSRRGLPFSRPRVGAFFEVDQAGGAGDGYEFGADVEGFAHAADPGGVRIALNDLESPVSGGRERLANRTADAGDVEEPACALLRTGPHESLWRKSPS